MSRLLTYSVHSSVFLVFQCGHTRNYLHMYKSLLPHHTGIFSQLAISVTDVDLLTC